ncbi:hypothetical protein [Methanobacterium formicicum]|uniref:hypothetical protein n=1 Tax=Methanobacterium formicicum TaxID=2162 RepID=UPI00248FDDDC|nr:hypothetical protein [Methanobacterium formicicum]
MIILVIALVLGVGSVAAASQDNTSPANNSTSITTVPETHTDNTVNSDPAAPADPQIWRDGAPVADTPLVISTPPLPRPLTMPWTGTP